MVIRPRDAAVQILAGNWDLARHEMGKLWQAAGGSIPRLNHKLRTVGLWINASKRVRNQIIGNWLRRGK